MAAEPTVDVALEIPDTDAEGPGRRYAIWVQGCPLRCPGCCNPELLRFGGGRETAWTKLRDRILVAAATCGIEGVSFLGGEPFSAAAGLAPLAAAVREAGLSVMIYSGWTLDELRARPEPEVARLLAACDVLVDGRYDRDKPDSMRRFVGSRNQVVHLFGDRHRADDPRWLAPRTVELRLDASVVTISGWPVAGLRMPRR